jgi:hypothetical protein
MTNTLTLMHPASRQTIEVAASVADRYRSQGWRLVAPDAPKGNASLAKWQEYARARGFTDAEIAGMSRADLRAALA